MPAAQAGGSPTELTIALIRPLQVLARAAIAAKDLDQWFCKSCRRLRPWHRTSEDAHEPVWGERSLSHPRFAGGRAVPSSHRSDPAPRPRYWQSGVAGGGGWQRQILRLRQSGAQAGPPVLSSKERRRDGAECPRPQSRDGPVPSPPEEGKRLNSRQDRKAQQRR